MTENQETGKEFKDNHTVFVGAKPFMNVIKY
jgi:hypothetical protein